MKNFSVFFLVSICLLAVWCVSDFTATAQKQTDEANLISTTLVISQFQAGGGTANDEFIELHNVSAASIDLNGYRLVYRPAATTTELTFATWTTSTIIPSGGYFLIASTAYDGGVTPNTTYDPAVCLCSMGAGGGGLAIRQGAVNTGTIIDSVGWGTATNIFVEGTVTAAPANNDSRVRAANGCQDTDNNANDFSALSPAAARNAATTPFPCSGSGSNLFASMSANPSSVIPGASTLLTVTVIPATTPPSTGITVVGNLSNIGGSASQSFFDNGTNGDTTAGDNVFSFSATIPTEQPGGTQSVTAVASDAQARTANANINININAASPNDDPLLLGNPSGATGDVANENNYLMIKPQYTLSYSRSKATANWVAWRLDSSWLGSTPRQDDYRPDTSLPAGWYQVQSNSFSGSGFDRGHLTPSADRTSTVADNSATFLMTNFIPQAPNNNQGPWEELESYLRTLIGQGNEIYIIAGGAGQGGVGSVNANVVNTVDSGRVVVPATTWKIALVLPTGTNDLDRIVKNTRVIAVNMPNRQDIGINTPWRNFRVNVRQIEALTGLNFFTNVRPQMRLILKKKLDNQ